MDKYLGVDFGSARTGLALSDALGILAYPLAAIRPKGLDDAAGQIIEHALKNGAAGIVIGLPKNMDGTEGASAKKCRLLGEKISLVFKGPVIVWDERLSTVAASRALSEAGAFGKKRRAAIDCASAVIILQSYIDSIK